MYRSRTQKIPLTVLTSLVTTLATVRAPGG